MSGRVVALAGSTGLVGSFLLERLLADDAVARVIAPARRARPARPKLDAPLLSGREWPAPGASLDEAYCALGTTRADAGSDAAFRAVDFDLAVSFARAAKAAGARRFGLVSSVGADAQSPFLYPRVKGEAERAIAGLGFESFVIARPALLLGARAVPRAKERLAEGAFVLLSPLMTGPLARYRPVRAEAVARSLIAAVRGGVPGALVVESDSIE